jgi:hypothetical protein
VFDEVRKHHPDCVYLTSTRHPVDGELLCEFKEEHSHATDHLIYYPVHTGYAAHRGGGSDAGAGG